MGRVPPLRPGSTAGRRPAGNTPWDAVVVGGGPAGLTAAIEAGRAGRRTLLLEKEPQPGQKLLLTGRGRCNLTNDLPLQDFIAAYGPGGRFLHNAFSRFFSRELIAYLADMAVPTARERGGRYYPSRGGARSVLEALVKAAVKGGVHIEKNSPVRSLSREENCFRLGGTQFDVQAHTVIVATGGASFPWTGSSGDGYGLAKSSATPSCPVPALVPVRCSDSAVAALAGLRLKNVRLHLPKKKGKGRESFGEVHFTDFGISGPAVFPLSREIAVAARKGPVRLTLCFKPALDEKKLENRLLREIGSSGGRTLEGLMERLLPRQAVAPFLAAAGLRPERPAAELKKAERRAILSLLLAFPLTATGTLPLERAMVTSGGVRLSEIDPGTMESRRVPGLFFCGEVLDLDGTTGGFNLQAAFSTGYLAGRAAAGRER